MAAILLIDQVGLSAGNPGFARTDGLNTGALVTVQSVGGGTTHEARLLTVPEADTTAVGSFTQTSVSPPVWTFSPQAGVDGMHRIELVVDRGLPSEDRQVLVFGIRNSSGLLFPSFGLVADPQANIPDLSNPADALAFIRANELNEPTVLYPNGYPFGWHREVDTILRSAVSSTGANTVGAGTLLWEWNRSDITQFDVTARRHERDIGSQGGGNANTALALSVVNVGQPFGNVLRVTATSLQGGGYFPISASELTLPEQFVLYVRWASQALGGNLFGAFYLFSNNDGSNFHGAHSRRYFGSSSAVVTAIPTGQAGNSASYTSSGTHNATQADKGGIEQWIGVVRPNGDTPAYSRAYILDRGGASNTQPFDSEILSAISGVSPDWDGIDMTTNPGPGAYEAINGSSGTVDFAGIKIYELAV